MQAKSAVQPRTVLVVDDEPLVTIGLREELVSYGLEVEVAETLRDALRCFRYGHGQLRALIVDIGLPDGSGEELVRRVRTVDPDLPIVLISGYSHLNLSSRYCGDRHLQLIEKPFDYPSLQATLEMLGVLTSDGDFVAPRKENQHDEVQHSR